MQQTGRFRRIAVVAHPQIPEAIKQASSVAAYLQQHGAEVAYGLLNDEDIRTRIEAKAFDLLVALGGDGTMLRSGHLCGPSGIPILGINMGRFGFLMEVRENQWKELIPRLFSGDYWIENRMMLCAEQERQGEHLGSWDVVNEVVVSRGSYVRPVHLETSVDNRFLATYVADGLIASTPTGSTAYALAVGGPILPPELRTILLVPIAPHLSIDRAIVLAEGSSLSITVHTSHQAVLSVDGQPPVDLADGDCVNVFASNHTLMFVRFQDPGYFYRNLTPHMSHNPSIGNQR
ncbi:MAG TPA: NAD(+)/NADH kinase [Anaerolineales bacterium]|nr:NAD(+)/NADH kinase [Anaerolineales bacterium]